MTTKTPTYVEARREAERKVVTKLIEIALARGFTLHSVSDGEEREKVSTTEQALEVVFSVDESTIYFAPPATSEDKRRHCAVIVLGNSGWDAVADASVGPGWDEVMRDHNEWVDSEFF